MEEGVARVSHDLRNQLAAIRNAMFYLRKRFEPTQTWEADPRVAKFVAMIEQQLVDAVATVAGGAVSRNVYAPERERTSLARLVEAALTDFAAGCWTVPVQAKIQAGDGSVDAAQLVVGIARLLEAMARQTGAEHLTLEAGPLANGYRICVTATPGQAACAEAQPAIDLSWAIARRVAMLHQAQFERAQDGLRAAFTVRDAETRQAENDAHA